MGFFTGRTGRLVYLGKPVAKIRDWSVETSVELLNTNAIDSVVNTFTPGIKSATGSATLIYYRLEPGESDTRTSFVRLVEQIVTRGRITEDNRVLLDLDVGAGTSNDLKFNAYITSATISVSTGELSVVPIQFTMDGDFISVIGGS
jgi:hypothetical protein